MVQGVMKKRQMKEKLRLGLNLMLAKRLLIKLSEKMLSLLRNS